MGGSSRVEMVAVQISYRGEAEIVQVRYNRLDIATESDCALEKRKIKRSFIRWQVTSAMVGEPLGSRNIWSTEEKVS